MDQDSNWDMQHLSVQSSQLQGYKKCGVNQNTLLLDQRIIEIEKELLKNLLSKMEWESCDCVKLR